MPSPRRTRICLATIGLSAIAIALSPSAAPAQGHSGNRGTQNRLGPHHDQHLAQWMDSHRSLPLPQQQKALEGEPGFHDLSPEVQQRMLNRLTQLNAMSPARRQRIIDRTEALERLAPEQRQQFRSAMSSLASLPPERRHAVSEAFRELRALPPGERSEQFSRDPRFQQGFSPQERATLGNLLAIEPLLPPLRPRLAPQQSPVAPRP